MGYYKNQSITPINQRTYSRPNRRASGGGAGFEFIDDIRITNDNLLRAMLGALPTDIQKEVLHVAVARANRSLYYAFKDVVPVKTGVLRRSMSVKIKDYRQGTVVVGIVRQPMEYQQMIPILGE
jgi:hypothetical protein